MLNNEPMTLKSWLDYLESLNQDKIELGLSRVKIVLERLGLRFLGKSLIVEVAGTNGKGSVSALIAGALSLSGINTGLYTSPHLYSFTERVNINGRPVNEQDLVNAFCKVKKAAGEIKLTYFEYTTLAALCCFDDAKVRVCVLEIGLGGRLDAVNAVDADIAVITSIGLDHTAILGNTKELIASEKAGIIKYRCQVVAGKLDKGPLEVIKDKAEAMHAEFFAENHDFSGYFNDNFCYIQKDCDKLVKSLWPYPKVPECCAPVALRVLMLLKDKGLDISDAAIAKAFDTVSLPGRMQKVLKNPDLYLDVAHNPPAAEHLVLTVEKHPIHTGQRRILVIGMLKDKDIESVIKIVSPKFDLFFACTLHVGRGANSRRIAEAIKSSGVDPQRIFEFDTVDKGLDCALSQSKSDDEIMVMGSFVTVAEASSYLNNHK